MPPANAQVCREIGLLRRVEQQCVTGPIVRDPTEVDAGREDAFVSPQADVVIGRSID